MTAETTCPKCAHPWEAHFIRPCCEDEHSCHVLVDPTPAYLDGSQRDCDCPETPPGHHAADDWCVECLGEEPEPEPAPETYPYPMSRAPFRGYGDPLTSVYYGFLRPYAQIIFKADENWEWTEMRLLPIPRQPLRPWKLPPAANAPWPAKKLPYRPLPTSAWTR